MKPARSPTTGLVSNCAEFRGEKVIFLFEISMRSNGMRDLKQSLVVVVRASRLLPLELLGRLRL